MGKIKQLNMPPGARRDFFVELRRLHRHAGEPSTRELAGEIAVSHTTVHSALLGTRLPRWPVVELLVEQLHGDVSAVKALWIGAREAEDDEGSTDSVSLPAATSAEQDAWPNGVPLVRPYDRYRLTKRELAVLKQLTDGRTNRLIARDLHIEESTVSVHVSHIFGKLGAASRLEAAAIAHRERFFAN